MKNCNGLIRLGLYSALCLLSSAFNTLPQAHAETLVVDVPRSHSISVARAIERGTTLDVAGVVNGHEAKFDLHPDTPYDLTVEQTDGTLLCGADLSWCDDTPPDPQAEAIGDDDREQIRAIVQDIPQFGNKPKILILKGDHDRAVALVESSRISAFHSDKGDEVIWRVEVWFFKWQSGGWERVSNQSRLLRRERFPSTNAYEKELKCIHWLPALGGIRLPKGAQNTTVQVTADQPVSPPATKASDSSAEPGRSGSPP